MKHWDGRDRPEAAALPRLPRQDHARLAQMFEAPVRSRRQQPQFGSVIGLVLAVGVLVGLAWMLAPTDPVSSRLIN